MEVEGIDAQLAQRPAMMLPRLDQRRQRADELAAGDPPPLQVAGFPSVGQLVGQGIERAGRRALPARTAARQRALGAGHHGAHELDHRLALVVDPTRGVLAGTEAVLGRGAFLDRPQRRQAAVLGRDGNQLVDESGRRRSRTRHETRADPVPVHRCTGQGGDRILVEVGRDDDPGRGGAQLVEEPPGASRLVEQIAGVEADGTRTVRPPLPAELDRRPDRLVDVVGVDEERGARAHCVELGSEGGALIPMGEHEGVGGRAGCRYAVHATRLEVRRRSASGDVGSARRRHRRLLVGATRAHLDDRPALGGADDARGRRRYGRVEIEDGQDHRLEEDGLPEGGFDRHDRAAGEITLPLGVRVEVSGEAERP